MFLRVAHLSVKGWLYSPCKWHWGSVFYNVFEVEETASFVTIKKWFFDTYSELSHKADNRQKRINQILAEAEAKAKAKANADSIAA